jgi:hypothetical protein
VNTFKSFEPFNRYAESALSAAEGFKSPPGSRPARALFLPRPRHPARIQVMDSVLMGRREK